MHPEVIVKEEKMAEHLETWEADMKVLANQGQEFELNDQMKFVALEIMFAKFPSIFEAVERGVKEQDPKVKFPNVFAD